MRLKGNQLCPLHRRRDCCGRAEFARYIKPKHTKWETIRPGWRRIKDATNPRGYRYKLSPAEMRKVIDRKIAEQNHFCGICGLALTDYTDVVPDHKEPRGLGGATRDDHPENIQAAHSACNLKKGSRRV